MSLLVAGRTQYPITGRVFFTFEPQVKLVTSAFHIKALTMFAATTTDVIDLQYLNVSFWTQGTLCSAVGFECIHFGLVTIVGVFELMVATQRSTDFFRKLVTETAEPFFFTTPVVLTACRAELVDAFLAQRATRLCLPGRTGVSVLTQPGILALLPCALVGSAGLISTLRTTSTLAQVLGVVTARRDALTAVSFCLPTFRSFLGCFSLVVLTKAFALLDLLVAACNATQALRDTLFVE